MKIFNIFKKKKNSVPPQDIVGKSVLQDEKVVEVDKFCHEHNIIDGNLRNKILELAKIQGLKNYIKEVQKIKPVMIVANGPGFKFCEISNRNREDYVFCFMNNSPLANVFWEIKPEYYIQADPLFFQKDINREDILMTREKLLNDVSWDIVFFVPYSKYEKAKDIYSYNSYLNIIPYHDTNLSVNMNKDDKNLIFHLGLDAPIVQNVLIGAIYCLINTGYKEIELYGATHSWTTQLTVNNKNEVCLRDEHFYDNQNPELRPWYKVTGTIYKMHEILRDLAQMFDSYWVLKDYAESKGVKIINKTKNSFIDAFERGGEL